MGEFCEWVRNAGKVLAGLQDAGGADFDAGPDGKLIADSAAKLDFEIVVRGGGGVVVEVDALVGQGKVAEEAGGREDIHEPIGVVIPYRNYGIVAAQQAGRASRDGNFLERAVAEIAIEQVSGGLTLIVEAADVEIEIAIVVEIGPRQFAVNADMVEARVRDVAERTIVVVAEKLDRGAGGRILVRDGDIHPAIVVIITPRRPHVVAGQGEARSGGHVYEVSGVVLHEDIQCVLAAATGAKHEVGVAVVIVITGKRSAPGADLDVQAVVGIKYEVCRPCRPGRRRTASRAADSCRWRIRWRYKNR